MFTHCLLQVALLVVLCRQSDESRHAISVSGASLSLIATVFLVPLSHLEHVRTIRPSFLISAYLCTTLLLRCAVARTYWLIQPHGALASITLSGILVQIILIVLENVSKDLLKQDSGIKLSSEEKAGFLSRSLFAWLNSLFYTGYRRPLVPSDLGPIDPNLGASKLLRDFQALQMYSKGM